MNTADSFVAQAYCRFACNRKPRIMDAIDQLNPSPDSHVDIVRTLIMASKPLVMFMYAADRSGLWQAIVGADDEQMQKLSAMLVPIAAFYQIEAEYTALGMDVSQLLLGDDQVERVKAELRKRES